MSVSLSSLLSVDDDAVALSVSSVEDVEVCVELALVEAPADGTANTCDRRSSSTVAASVPDVLAVVDCDSVLVDVDEPAVTSSSFSSSELVLLAAVAEVSCESQASNDVEGSVDTLPLVSLSSVSSVLSLPKSALSSVSSLLLPLLLLPPDRESNRPPLPPLLDFCFDELDV